MLQEEAEEHLERIETGRRQMAQIKDVLLSSDAVFYVHLDEKCGVQECNKLASATFGIPAEGSESQQREQLRQCLNEVSRSELSSAMSGLDEDSPMCNLELSLKREGMWLKEGC